MLIQEDYFKNIFNTAREAILILDENMRVLSANRSFFITFKVDAANTIGTLLYDLGNGQWDIPELRVLLEDILSKNETVDSYEIEHKFESIGQKTMLLNAGKIREKKNDLPIILLAIEDITARKEIEKGLEKARKELEVTKISEDEAREYAEGIINTVRKPLIVLDQDLRVVTASRSFYEVFKVKPEETVGQLIYDLGNKQWDIPKLRELLEDILPKKAAFDNYEVEHDFIIIGRRIMLLNAREIQRKLGKERIILLALEDITDRRLAEEHIKKLNTDLQHNLGELASANKELEAFSYSVSHDLRNPLNRILGFSDVLLEGYSDKLDDEGKSHLNRVIKNAVRMNRIIDDLLHLSRISRQGVQRQDVDLSKLAASVAAELREAQPDRGATVDIQEGITAFADVKLIEVALSNLLGNAWKFTSKIQNARIQFGTFKQDGKTVYYVKDNGAGFDQSLSEKLFLAFHRLHSDEEFEGTGIGLATVQRIIHRHGGKVWADGEPGKGAMFSFTLE